MRCSRRSVSAPVRALRALPAPRHFADVLRAAGRTPCRILLGPFGGSSRPVVLVGCILRSDMRHCEPSMAAPSFSLAAVSAREHSSVVPLFACRMPLPAVVACRPSPRCQAACPSVCPLVWLRVSSCSAGPGRGRAGPQQAGLPLGSATFAPPPALA